MNVSLATRLSLVGLFWGSIVAAGVYPRADVRPLECSPPDGNALVELRLHPLPEGLRPEDVDSRVYFRRGSDDALESLAQSRTPRPGHGNFFYVPAYPWEDVFDPEIAMPEAGSWSHWAVLPVPQEENLTVEHYVAVYDATGRLLFQSPVAWAPVTDDCEVELSDEQADFADSLLIGETVADQEGKRVIWWECEGLDTRINVDGELRDDRSCFVLIPWWGNPAVLIPAATGGGIGIIAIVEDDPGPPDVSPSAP